MPRFVIFALAPNLSCPHVAQLIPNIPNASKNFGLTYALRSQPHEKDIQSLGKIVANQSDVPLYAVASALTG